MAHLVDQHVGRQVRLRRTELGMTQDQLAQCVGVKFQQIQKYESGSNRISASRLWEIATALNVKVAYFFHGLKENGVAQWGTLQDGTDDVLDLIQAYKALPQDQREAFTKIAKGMVSVT